MCSKFLILALIIVSELVSVQSLAVGAPGVCETIKQVKKTRTGWVKVTTNKWCGPKRCVVQRKRPISYMDKVKQLVCCTGYVYRAETDSCVPNCSTGCFGGRCVAPDKCVCDPPAHLHPQRKNTCVTPTCNPSCVNGQCVNETCVCVAPYERFNNTHCYKCEDGYVIDATFTCQRHCDQGYSLRGDQCEPICDCVNAKCVAPNTCECFEGYAKQGEKCEPVCQCDGKCVAPNVCECHEGFRNVSGHCEPKCDECANGACVAPNICECNEGFAKNNTSGQCYDCTKKCLNCYNGVCLDCKPTPKRVKYVCCDGYVYDAQSKSCQLKCKQGCIKGICVSLNRCICTPPLVLHNNNECIQPAPTCDSPCINGKCTDHNTCTCNPGYIFQGNFTCVPECNPQCEHGTCVSPNLCACFEGYSLSNASNYHLNSSKCEPVCINCEHGECIGPMTCKCHEGYSRINERCEPVCKRPCVNGSCVEPDKCACFDGYESNPSDPYTCRPVCATTCINSSCTAPYTCTCNRGFKPAIEGNSKSRDKCEPFCRRPCVNGTCSEPDKCSCFDGYELDALEINVCRPSCKSQCINGSCIAPDVCGCLDGYKRVNETVCSPICHDCTNGDCVAPNVCRCHEGYSQESRNNSQTFSCFKKCSCDNGVCTDGECVCNRDFDLVNGTCVQVKPVACSSCNSNCPDGACWCEDGRPCYQAEERGGEEASAVRLAGIQMSWLLGGGVGLLLVIVIVVTITRNWRKRGYATETANGKAKPNVNNSVVFIAPDTLIQRKQNDTDDNDFDEEDEVLEKSPLSLELDLEERL